MGFFGKSLKKQLIDLALLNLKEGDEKNFEIYLNDINENITLNPGYTFVRKCMWGDKDMPLREVRYRTRSLSGRFYYDEREMSEAKKINVMSGSEFEEYCEKYLSQDKWKIT